MGDQVSIQVLFILVVCHVRDFSNLLKLFIYSPKISNTGDSCYLRSSYLRFRISHSKIGFPGSSLQQISQCYWYVSKNVLIIF